MIAQERRSANAQSYVGNPERPIVALEQRAYGVQESLLVEVGVVIRA